MEPRNFEYKNFTNSGIPGWGSRVWFSWPVGKLVKALRTLGVLSQNVGKGPMLEAFRKESQVISCKLGGGRDEGDGQRVPPGERRNKEVSVLG